MSKKVPLKQQKRNKPQIVDEQNEPFLRTLSKRVRNINKKLTEIAELENKDNLKPEQIEKINRKVQFKEERTKLEQTVQLFKNSYVDNAEQYRKLYQKELENLARAVTLFHAFPQFQGREKLASLWDGLSKVNGDDLTSATENLAKQLKETANDWKLQKSIDAFVNKNLEARIEEAQAPAQVEVVQVVEVHTDEVIVYHEETVNARGDVENIDIVEKLHDGVVEDVTVQVTIDTPIQEQPAAVEEPKKEVAEEKKEEERPKTRKYDRPARNNYRENRDNNQDRREGRPHYKEAEKRTYKPKYEPKEDKKSDDSSSEEEPKGFKRDEILKLQDEGFTVVGKPKPARPSHPQQNKKYRPSNNSHKN